ncbi:aminotransferase class I/II-fold pyridoxal phosphate-dependent enzyme [Desulfosarcina cetonica]|uniref:aminotransferase class I/II-fold pyridoxal phosphate-dependent enzyme n=1 Tax=Desulfosarcina cetonica TaxID=90730 RepID=UPI00248BBF24|nr:aminotransferase class I/II-fold pyridoxal phosphate-dependent enzyme [Desulfosarcina cetonica]
MAACLMVPNFHNPLGFVMPDEKKKALVAMMVEKNIPIIEDNIHGELYFGGQRPMTLKSLDRKGWCSTAPLFPRPSHRGCAWAGPCRAVMRSASVA